MKPNREKVAYVFDGSLEGFYTAVFMAFRDKTEPSRFLAANAGQQIPLLEQLRHAPADPALAARVDLGVAKRSGAKNACMLKLAFRSGQEDVLLLIWRYLCRLFDCPDGSFCRNMLDPDVWDVLQAARRVKREVHRFHGFVRFRKTADGFWFALIDPDNDIVDLLIPHFRGRYAARPWVIYDARRNRGIWYDGKKSHDVVLENKAFSLSDGTLPPAAVADDEEHYCRLWQHYYHSVSIAQRPNQRQMKAAMPRRYWKYLPEKQSGHRQ